VDPGFIHLTEEEKARAEAERNEIQKAYSQTNAQPLWDGSFQLPVASQTTDSFGSRRVFNRETRSIHYGLDLRAGTKTKVRAANAGQIVLAKNLFFAGNMIIIDHGAGIFSSYAHLSTIDVIVGQAVMKGQVLGLAGATGRVTGPHLHWGTRVNSIQVDPSQLLKIFEKM
jgi:murein DD-endopeptidase MepM/ murein hydrolase activator NlpD